MSKGPLPSSIRPWWVIPHQLAGAGKPTAASLTDLRAEGIGALVSLLSDDANLDLYQQHHIPHLWVPIQGGTAPSLAQLKQITTFVATQHQLGNAVAIHCSSGRRRTGTVLIALLMGQQGMSYDQALNTILSVNPAVKLRNAQITFLQALSC